MQQDACCRGCCWTVGLGFVFAPVVGYVSAFSLRQVWFFSLQQVWGDGSRHVWGVDADGPSLERDDDGDADDGDDDDGDDDDHATAPSQQGLPWLSVEKEVSRL